MADNERFEVTHAHNTSVKKTTIAQKNHVNQNVFWLEKFPLIDRPTGGWLLAPISHMIFRFSLIVRPGVKMGDEKNK